ncbi:MAG: DUF2617 family protein, partial [Bacteroidota bacterium]
MIIKDISYKKLQLALLEGSVDLSHLSIFQKSYNKIPTLGLSIYAGIIGTSHFVQIQQDTGNTFTEIFACDALENNQHQPLLFSSIKKIQQPVRIEHSWLDYHFEFSRKSYVTTSQWVTEWSKKIQQTQPLTYLEYHFDLKNYALPSSKTVLAIRRTTEGILIQTIH